MSDILNDIEYIPEPAPIDLLIQMSRKDVDPFLLWCEENNPTIEEMRAEMERRLGRTST